MPPTDSPAAETPNLQSVAARVQAALRSLHVLFPAGDFSADATAARLDEILSRMDSALNLAADKREKLLSCNSSDQPDVIDALNCLALNLNGEPFRKSVETTLLKCLSRTPFELTPKVFEDETGDAFFLYSHAKNVAEIFQALIPDFLAQLSPATAPTDSRLLPSVAKFGYSDSFFSRYRIPAILQECSKLRNRAEDVFHGSRVFRYETGKCVPLELKSIRAVDAFYGYRAARQTFLDHFGAFAAGKSNLPLLISSLPGLGKTQMTIAHTLHYPQITLILASPDVLSHGLETLIRTLAQQPKRKFMVFFDDIDVPQMDWYDFRTHVGGAFSLPENISFTIAANQQFPANISSRGRGFVFPIFDEIRCQEMVEDFLISIGVKNPTPELISVIAADYVEAFGQKLFEELSPRTLVRYLEVYRTDAQKRRRMLESSRNDVITRPDPQVFYDENLKLMRAIYGDAILDDMRNKALGVK